MKYKYFLYFPFTEWNKNVGEDPGLVPGLRSPACVSPQDTVRHHAQLSYAQKGHGVWLQPEN